MKRYMVFHESKSGFETPEDAQDWINYNCPGDTSYRVVAFEADSVHVEAANVNRKLLEEAFINKGIRQERERIKKLLGLY